MEEAEARKLFDANAETYDRVNSIVSLGLDSRWYAWAARQAVVAPGDRVLDAFAGTGGVGLRAAALGADVTLADGSPMMLDVATQRARSAGLDVRAETVDLTADPLRFDRAPFDAITVMWGLRYLDDPSRVLRALATLLRPGGRLVVVDFVEPDGGVVSQLADVYFFRILPRIASALAGKRELYRELVTTTHAMGPAEHLAGLVEAAGFAVTEQRRMGFGLVRGIVAELR